MAISTQINSVPVVPAGSLGLEAPLSPRQLANVVMRFASFEQWVSAVRLRVDRRWYERVYSGPEHDIWIISWMPGQSTGFHDHGGSAGAFVVATGTLVEHQHGESVRVLTAGDSRAFGADYAHDVRNVSAAPAVTIHAYSPPLNEMNEYEVEDDELVLRPVQKDHVESGFSEAGSSWGSNSIGPLGIDEVLATARARLRRLSPIEAFKAASHGAVLVDIRPASQRAAEGSIPGALIVERNVLEWRFDPTSSSRLTIVKDYNLQIVIFCSEGYTSSLAAAALQELGLQRATDVVGGFKSWLAHKLPISESGRSPSSK
jgi:rhodanese-related sulfurtransferase/mannose-6-phosphate isomerase-like protein (cupin superfamily)